MHESTVIQRALLSVYDKTNILPLAECLHLRGVELISTGNTAALLKEHGIPVTLVNEYTGFPEIMQGRVKTLHPKIAGGILGRRDIDTDVMIAHDIHDIDLVVVNLYPFEKVSRDTSAKFEDIIENIDIGGPTLIRSAAKNYEWCTVLVDPNDYKNFMNELEENHGTIKEETRFLCAVKAFAQTAAYDSNIANFFGQVIDNQPLTGFGRHLSLNYQLKERLRYGENPHQQAAFYQENSPLPDSITGAVQLQGKALSYNNIQDADCALECVKDLMDSGCVIVKHANPCGVGIGKDALSAYEKAYACDPTSAFGGIIAFNKEIDEQLMKTIMDKQFVEVLIAPNFSSNAIMIAKQKENCRLLQYQPQHEKQQAIIQWDIKSVNGGILIQHKDNSNITTIAQQIVSKRAPTKDELQDLLFSWHIVKYVKSNAIVFAKNGQTLGIGAGQMSRIFSTEIAALKAHEMGLNLAGAVMASDAFFPFKDNVEKAHELGITAIISPGGSKRDNEVIECANKLGIAMIFTQTRRFKH
ncbi:MAG: bifunctional phosphoribosylaminoimidazolecarboxamide formyltransferase/IMP cyclohydrolase [Gammaproteobacteria bacterium]|jgi:phosphoribosylaminoimidazolecarboxamide formyltransferase/IMP cyclohydrolase|nr:bifunctional phosphoribosylaminoimidazolecarboxamide formyltransferase/IMP cyclohydrolase [Gammaproteobacteria bacterium]